MLTTILIVIGLSLGIPLGVVALFFFLPIRVGASGFYRDDDYSVSGFARGWAGLCVAVCKFDSDGLQLRVVLGPWTVWAPKDVEDEDEVPPIEESTPPAPVVETQTATLPEVAVMPEPSERDIFSVQTEDQPDTSSSEVIEDAEPEQALETSADIDDGQADDSPAKTPPVEVPDEVDADEVREEPWWQRFQTLRTQIYRYLDYVGDARPILFRFLKRLLRIIRFRHLDLDIELGIGDPALMGRLFGYVEAFKRMVNRRVHISLTPDFVQTRFAGSGAFKISIHLYRLIWAILCLAGRGAVLGAKVWWTERKAKQEAQVALEAESV